MAECPGIHKLAEMKDGLLARLRVPGGVLTYEHAGYIAYAAEKFGNGIIDLTNRANLQLRGIKPSHQQALIVYLIEHNLVTSDPAHDRLRNITIDPLSGLVQELFDCTALAHELDKALIELTDKQSFSPKMAFVLDGGGPTQISALSHDFAFMAQQQNSSKEAGSVEFHLLICGIETAIFIRPENLIKTVLEILARLKTCKTKSAALAEETTPALRMKNLLQEIGIEEILKLIDLPVRKSHQVNSDPSEKKVKRHIVQPPATILMQHPIDVSKSANNSANSSEEIYALNLASPTARLRSFHLKGLAELANTYGNGQIRLTSWQSVILPSIDADHISEVWEKAEAMAMLTQQSEQNLQIISCSGSEGCIYGGYETKLNALKIREQLAEMETITPVTIHLSACEKGCATRARSNYLFLQRRGSDQLTLHVNAAPDTNDKGKTISERQMAAELKKLI